MNSRGKFSQALGFALIGKEVMVLNSIWSIVGREELREQMMHDLKASHVWFGDEIGTDKDPIRGPNPIKEIAEYRNAELN